ncbi:hypothetical protein [Paenibacillus sp. P46E]|uniref:hypothetical protein n=1 Tax=Paenibacillus sp. P46E TaxID=1349436 RepID=UPI00093FDC6D|nr:hypothetical protein [Paenibacillus sp. P46E]OKP97755.1 hypothetical protein A3849_13695 [Paenibacillus sp. P46E]
MTFRISGTVRCPYPNCGHTGDVITVNHCRKAHGIERAELFGKYGKPVAIRIDTAAAKKNLEGHVPVNSNDRRASRKA